MEERKRIAAILRTFAKDVEECKKLDKYKELELTSIYVWGKDSKGIQVPVIVRKTDNNMPGLGMRMPKEGREDETKED